MNILVTTPYYHPKVGGLENYANQINQGLSGEYKHQITVLTSKHLENLSQEETHNGIKIVRLPITFKLSNTPIGLSWKHQIEQQILSTKPDIIISHTPVPIISDITIRLAKKHQIKSILVYHNDIHKDNPIFKLINILYFNLLGRKTLNQATKIVATSGVYVNNSLNLSKYKNKIVIIPPGVSKSAHEIKYQPESPYALFVGQLDLTHEHKGLKYLLEAIKILSSSASPINLKIIGKGDGVGKYKQITKSLGIENLVEFMGFKTTAEMSESYANAPCLCLPSTSEAEGFGMVVLEAAAQKTPSIGSDIGGINQSILNNITGLLVSPRNVKQLAAAIDKLLSHQELRNTLGQAAYERVMKEFVWTQQVSKTNDLINQLVS